VSSASTYRPLRCAEKPSKARTIFLLTIVALALVVVIRATPTVEALDSEEQAFLQLINTYRQQNGLQPLNLSPTLTTAAELHSQDMADKNYFSHTSLDGRTYVQRIRGAGYTYDTWLGENIAAGYSTAEAVFNGWKSSPPHNTNMLRPEFNVIGIGRAYNASSNYKWYWTTDFGGYDDSGQEETTTTIFSGTTTTVLAVQTTVATTTVTTTSTSTLTQTSTRTVTTAASTSTVSLTTLTTTLELTKTASSTTYTTWLTTATTTAILISTKMTTVSTTESWTYTFLITYTNVSTVATTTNSTTTQVQVTTLTAGATTETSTSTVEKKDTVTKIMVETSTRTVTTLYLSTQKVTVTFTQPVLLTETVTVHQSTSARVETATRTTLPSGFSWHQDVPVLLTMVSLAAVVAALAARVLRKH